MLSLKSISPELQLGQVSVCGSLSYTNADLIVSVGADTCCGTMVSSDLH